MWLLRRFIDPRYGGSRIVGKQAPFMAGVNCGGLLHWSAHEGLAWGMGMVLVMDQIKSPLLGPFSCSRICSQYRPQELFTRVCRALC